MVRSEEAWLTRLVEDPDTTMREGTPLKLGNSCTVVRTKLKGHTIVIKRYNTVDPLRYMKRCWRTSRAKKAWLNGHCLKSLGISTPRPLAIIEERLGPLCGRAWLVTEYINGINILDFLKEHQKDDAPDTAKKALEALFNRLYRERITHGDMKGTNLVWHDNRFWLIDLDAMRVHRSKITFKKAWRRDRLRFFKNWENNPRFLSWVRENFPT